MVWPVFRGDGRDDGVITREARNDIGRLMNSATIAVVFLAVWLGVLLLYCVFRLCGGRIVDILSCDCCTGALCDCWGAGGQIDEYDNEYPFQTRHNPYGPWNYPPVAPPQPSLPPIVIVNKTKGDDEYRARPIDYVDAEESGSGYGSDNAMEGNSVSQRAVLLSSSYNHGRAESGWTSRDHSRNAAVVV